MCETRQFQAIAALSVESDLVRFSVLSATDGREIATASRRLALITDRTWDEPATNTSENYGDSATGNPADEQPDLEKSTAERLLPFDETITEQVAAVETLNDRIMMRSLSSHELLLNDVQRTTDGEKWKRRRADGVSCTKYNAVGTTHRRKKNNF